MVVLRVTLALSPGRLLDRETTSRAGLKGWLAVPGLAPVMSAPRTVIAPRAMYLQADSGCL